MTPVVRTLPEMRKRLRTADQAAAALILAYGSERHMQAICAVLNDHHQLLAEKERDHGRTLAAAPGDGR